MPAQATTLFPDVALAFPHPFYGIEALAGVRLAGVKSPHDTIIIRRR